MIINIIIYTMVTDHIQIIYSFVYTHFMSNLPTWVKSKCHNHKSLRIITPRNSLFQQTVETCVHGIEYSIWQQVGTVLGCRTPRSL